MRWEPKLAKAPVRAEEVWDTNERILQEWNAHVGKRGAANTQRNHRVYVRVFVGFFDALVTTLDRSDMEAFVSRISTKCAKLMNGAEPQCLAKQPIATCPLLTGMPGDVCPRYQALDPSGVWSYICSVNRFYEWLIEEGRVAKNPMVSVMRDFASRHSELWDERRRKPRRRELKVEDVRTLVTRSPPHHAMAYLLMAKCFMRIHEVLKLRADPLHFNIQEGWMDIPSNWMLGNKRKGNKRIILDAELRRFIRTVYWPWREDHIARTPAGDPAHDAFLITTFGKPWGKAAQHNLNTTLHTDAVRLGLMTGRERRREERVNSHGFRAFASTWARSKGISSLDLLCIRGDIAPGSLEFYDHYLARLPGLYRQFAPSGLT